MEFWNPHLATLSTGPSIRGHAGTEVKSVVPFFCLLFCQMLFYMSFWICIRYQGYVFILGQTIFVCITIFCLYWQVHIFILGQRSQRAASRCFGTYPPRFFSTASPTLALHRVSQLRLAGILGPCICMGELKVSSCGGNTLRPLKVRL